MISPLSHACLTSSQLMKVEKLFPQLGKKMQTAATLVMPLSPDPPINPLFYSYPGPVTPQRSQFGGSASALFAFATIGHRLARGNVLPADLPDASLSTDAGEGRGNVSNGGEENEAAAIHQEVQP